MAEASRAVAADDYNEVHDAHSDHPTEAAYWQIFAILAVLTAVEVAWSYLGLEGVALWLPLIVMMLAKFVMVAGWFMHLKYDLSFLNGEVFSWVFGFGLVLAVIVYAVVFFTFATP